MPEALLRTKLFVPPLRPNLVPRPGLIARLNQGLQPGRKLTLVSAPAGFGKTTLVSEWVAEARRPAAWLSLDSGDNDPMRFLAYLVAALQTIVPEIGAGALTVLHSPQPPPVEWILTTLLNEIAAADVAFILVLDDYQVIDAPAVGEALAFLLEHLPPQMHLAITSREDPPLPLPRLRARGQMTELRIVDLRFRGAEAVDFFNAAMGLNLAPAAVAALEARTEGWIAGLQMAALALQGLAVPGAPAPMTATEFIQAFTGSHRFVLDYLVEEVLQHQPETVRRFLLQTSILSRLCGPLCAAVTGQPDCQAMLEDLERGNLFVVPLDNSRRWYRYHHLFADVLQARARQLQPDEVPALHRRASRWYEQNELAAEAIHHALAAADLARAADLIELEVGLMRRGNEATWFGWVSALPEALIRARPVLSVYAAFAVLTVDGATAAARLADAERWLQAAQVEAEPAGMIVGNALEYESLPGTIAIARAYLAGASGDLPGILAYAQQALDRMPAHDVYWQGAATALLGIAHWTLGDLEAAQRYLAQAIVGLKAAGGLSAAVAGIYLQADIRLAQGRLREAAAVAQETLRLVAEQGPPLPQGTADLHVVLSDVYREQGDLAAAEAELRHSRELGSPAALVEPRHRWPIALAGIRAAQGDLEAAQVEMEKAAQMYLGGPTPEARPIAARQARLWLAQGRLNEALAWAQTVPVDDLSYQREFEQLTLARVRIAEYERDQSPAAIQEAQALLRRLRPAAVAGRRQGNVVEILIFQALAQAVQGDTDAALAPLAEALALAEPEGFVRVFVDQGAPLRRLLAEAARRGIRPEYGQKLLGAFDGTLATSPAGPVRMGAAELIEPLSQRELEILQLIAAGLSNREISDRLYLALSTVKGHNRRIFGKLAVSRRTEAVARARELGLV